MKSVKWCPNNIIALLQLLVQRMRKGRVVIQTIFAGSGHMCGSATYPFRCKVKSAGKVFFRAKSPDAPNTIMDKHSSFAISQTTSSREDGNQFADPSIEFIDARLLRALCAISKSQLIKCLLQFK